MSLENWMNTRKMVLLEEKRDHLFTQLPHAADFRMTRIELFDTLSKMAEYKRALRVYAPANWGITTVA